MIYVHAMESEGTWGRVASVTLNIEPYGEVCEEPVPSKTSSIPAYLYINIYNYILPVHKICNWHA